MGKFRIGLMGVFVLALLHGCASNVSVDYDRAINFNQYKTYALMPKGDKSTTDARLNSPLIDKRIVRALEENLRSKGFEKQSENPDFQVTYQINLHHEIATDKSGVSMAFGTGMGRTGLGLGYSVPTTDVESYEKGMLIIDIIAAETGQLLWRGTSSRRMSEASTPDEMDIYFKSLVKEILETFPPVK